MGLWNWVLGTIVVEGLISLAGLVIYLRATRARDRIGRFGLWGFLLFLLLSYVAALFNPPPPDIRPLAIGGIVFGWLFVAWACVGRSAPGDDAKTLRRQDATTLRCTSALSYDVASYRLSVSSNTSITFSISSTVLKKCGASRIAPSRSEHTMWARLMAW